MRNTVDSGTAISHIPEEECHWCQSGTLKENGHLCLLIITVERKTSLSIHHSGMVVAILSHTENIHYNADHHCISDISCRQFWLSVTVVVLRRVLRLSSAGSRLFVNT